MLQALGIVYSKIVLPSGDSKGEFKGRTYCPRHGTIPTHGNMQQNMQINCVKLVRVHFYVMNVL